MRNTGILTDLLSSRDTVRFGVSDTCTKKYTILKTDRNLTTKPISGTRGVLAPKGVLEYTSITSMPVANTFQMDQNLKRHDRRVDKNSLSSIEMDPFVFNSNGRASLGNFTMGKVSETLAEGKAAKVEEALALL